MASQPAFDRVRNINNFFSGIERLNEFDQVEIRNVVSSQLKPSLRETFVTLNYHRATLNIELLLTLTDTKQFQAIAMLARSVFELAVELKLMSVIADAANKIHVFTDVEKLRSARKILDFEERHGVKQSSAHKEFVDKNAQRINDAQKKFWPGVKRVDHWSLLDLSARTRKLGAPFDEIYYGNYPQMSWYVHSGVTGVANGNPQLFADLAGVAFIITYHSYEQILEAVIDEFKLHKADETLMTKLKFAKLVAFAETEDAVRELLEACTKG
jgi:hypothetical protein